METARDWQLEGARTQSLFRDVNERIVRITDALPGIEVMCECADERCKATIVLSQDEYDATRRIPTHFVVRPGHIAHDIERIVENHEHYTVVEKSGEAGKAAVRLDPRRRSTESSQP